MKNFIKETIQEYWPYMVISCGFVILYFGTLILLTGSTLR